MEQRIKEVQLKVAEAIHRSESDFHSKKIDETIHYQQLNGIIAEAQTAIEDAVIEQLKGRLIESALGNFYFNGVLLGQDKQEVHQWIEQLVRGESVVEEVKGGQ